MSEFKQQLESLELAPSQGGCFEFSIDGELLYSKLATGEFPDEQSIVQLIEKRLS